MSDLSGNGLISQATGQQGGDAVTKVAFTRGSIRYDSPFMDMTSTYIPKTIKGILQFIGAYIFGDGLVSQCITKMAEYPITALIYNDDEARLKDDKTIERWKDILEKKMKLSYSLKQAGMDYHGYGNSLISISYPFKRMLTCPKCKREFAAESVKTKLQNFKFYAKCANKGCDYNGTMEAKDISTKETNKIRIVHWDLLYLEIKFNPITGDHFYYYSIPKDLSNAIRRGDMDLVNTTRIEVIEAVKRNKPLKLMSDNIYHMKRPGPQYLYPSERGWGIPAVMPVMKDIFHTKILKKGNEMIAFDHIIPLRIIFPQGTGDVSPHATINLSSWKAKIEDEIRMWKADPNYISIVPLPIGLANFSGDSKILSVTPELRATEDTIITGLGIIPEIIRGGASWSGSNVSLRVIENSFINHREGIQNLIDFIVESVSVFIGIPKISIKMADFKMADDLQKKQIMVDASMRGPDSLVSRTTATKELGFDPDTEYDNKLAELKQVVELRIRDAEGNAEAAGAGSVINAMYQADAQLVNQTRLETNSQQQQQQRDAFKEEAKAENSGDLDQEVAAAEQSKGYEPGTMSLPQLIMLVTQRFAKLAQFDEGEFKIRMLAMKNGMPALYKEVYNNLKEMNLIKADLIPDMPTVEKYMPGQVPTYTQGDTYAEEPPSPSEIVAAPSTYDKVLPEARPPVSPNAPI